MTVGDRIRTCREAIGLSVDELAAKLGKSRATVYRYENGDISGLPTTVLEPLSRVLGVEPTYLMGWELADNTHDDPVPAGFEPLPDLHQVPLVGPVACGAPILAEQNIEAYVGVPSAWHADFVLRCQGDSMAPEIQDGDIVAIRKQERVEEGQIAVVLDGEECAATLKHFHQPAPDVVMLTPNNPAYPPLYFAGERLNDLKIEGLAVGICRGLV